MFSKREYVPGGPKVPFGDLSIYRPVQSAAAFSGSRSYAATAHNSAPRPDKRIILERLIYDLASQAKPYTPADLSPQLTFEGRSPKVSRQTTRQRSKSPKLD